ncbi:hypothetical protein D0Z68_02310 [Rickettsia japonica]|uniref:Uncharacterized protein n=1 Tax=Rickettsia japonica TaxID=35790 RepID=A0ABN5NYV7_RICJA|nr:hypothetical protein D0Z68_02310 [Rickettsia japonica]
MESFLRHYEQLKGAWQSQDCVLRLLRQLLRNFLAITFLNHPLSVLVLLIIYFRNISFPAATAF